MSLLSSRTVASLMNDGEESLRMISIIPPDESKSNKESIDDDEVRRRISYRWWREVENPSIDDISLVTHKQTSRISLLVIRETLFVERERETIFTKTFLPFR
jgi:hypothetical protein